MSAYVVSANHINALLTYANAHNISLCLREADGSVRKALNPSDTVDLQKAADLLYAQNVRSVCARYPQDTPRDYGTITFTFYWHKGIFGNTLKAVEAIKACQCYDYQACESDDYRDTSAHLIIDCIRRHAISELPGYEQAEWEID